MNDLGNLLECLFPNPYRFVAVFEKSPSYNIFSKNLKNFWAVGYCGLCYQIWCLDQLLFKF